MNELDKVLEKGRALIAFITAGDPDPAVSVKYALALQKGGADVLELGIPFSDPMAEGPVIQEANQRGLMTGVSSDDVFEMVQSLRAEGIDVPLAIMTYANVVFSYGTEAFLSRMEKAGFCALILPDVPYEEKGEFSFVAESHGIALISLIAPTSDERIRMIAADATGFIYCVSSLGVTGVRKSFSSNIGQMIDSVRSVRPDIPVAIGFGISDEESAKAMASLSDGVIIGSAIVRIIAEHGKDSPSHVRSFVRRIIKAIRE